MAVKKEDLALYGGRPVRESMPQMKVLAGDDEVEEVTKVIRSGNMTALSNEVVEKFEREFAEYCGAKYAVAVNSGTAALHVALSALDIGPGDEVIVPPYTFIATASAVLQQNAVPVFADIDPDTLNIDPADIERRITARTRAIIPVHLFGLPADMKSINRISVKHGIPVIEDACQAHGAALDGKKVGTLGNMGCFSFQESKNMTTGEGGIIVTDDEALAKRCAVIKHIGMAEKYQYVTLGYNYRMTAMAAAFGIAQIKKLDGFNRHRREMADYYRENLGDVLVETIDEPEGHVSANHLFPVKFPRESAGSIERMYEIYLALEAENVPAWWVYPMPIYKVKFFQEKKAYSEQCPFACPLREAPVEYREDECPNAEDVTVRTLVLITAPCYPKDVARDSVEALRKVAEWFAEN